MDEYIENKLKIVTEAAHNHYNRAEDYKNLLVDVIKNADKMDRFQPRTVDRFNDYLSNAVIRMAQIEFGEEE